MDVVELLRDSTVRGQPVLDQDTHLLFGDWRALKSAPTRCRAESGELYTLGTLWFCVLKRDLKSSEYTREAKRAGLATVQVGERKDITDYLTGKTATCSRLDRAALVPLAERVVATVAPVKRSADVMEAESAPSVEPSSAGATGGATLSVEQIAELQQKRKAAKMVSKTGSVEVALQPAHSSEVDSILARERVYEDRNTQLRGSDRQPLVGLVALLPHKRQQAEQARAQGKPVAQGAPIYDRYNQQGRRIPIDGGFQINEYGTNIKPVAAAPAPAGSAPPAAAQEQAKAPRKRVAQIPIIVVPASARSLLTLYNAKLFLEEGKFEPAEAFIARGAAKPSEDMLHRKIGGKMLPYKLVDGTHPLTREQWARVVAVWVAGPLWQLKDFPYPTPIEIFTHMRGFHLKYSDDRLEPNVQAWDVCVLQIDRSQRFKDCAAHHKFWEALDTFVDKKLPQFSVRAHMAALPG